MLSHDLLSITSLIASVFWWMQLTFAFLERNRKNNIKPDINNIPDITVVIPSYNENQDSIEKTVKSVLNQKNVNIEIIIVDDGSPNPVKEVNGATLIRLPKNKGKIEAQVAGIKVAKYDWIGTVDSDTTINEGALFTLYSTAISKNASACTGSVFLSNENKNLLTKMTACIYWFSFYQERASQSYFNSVTCCSGALSLYKKEIMLANEKEYINQKFFNIKCVAGDDRHMTNLFLLSGHKVVWSQDAIAYTHSPETLGLFFKQQLRWIRSQIHSFYFIIPRIHKWSLAYAIFTIKMNFTYAYMVFVYLAMFYSCWHYQSILPLVIILVSVLIVTLIKAIIAYIQTADLKFAYLLISSLFSFFIFNPIMIYGMLTPYKSSWLTRKTNVI